MTMTTATKHCTSKSKILMDHKIKYKALIKQYFAHPKKLAFHVQRLTVDTMVQLSIVGDISNQSIGGTDAKT